MNTNTDVFSGVANLYDKYRPRPPIVLLDILTQLAQTQRPRLIVDLGSGTGLSTNVWAARAESVIGIEPNTDMRQQAELHLARLPDVKNVRYQHGLSTQTGLPAGCADIVTCAQSLHWMEPEPTFAEVARILRPGGLFAAYDYDWPPLVNWEVEAAYHAYMSRVQELRNERELTYGMQIWPKQEHLSRMEASGRFRFVKEILVHHMEKGNAENFIGLALSNGIDKFLDRRMNEESGLESFRSAVRNALGDGPIPWYFSYRVRIGNVGA